VCKTYSSSREIGSEDRRQLKLALAFAADGVSKFSHGGFSVGEVWFLPCR
jgi:hypothetical protein